MSDNILTKTDWNNNKKEIDKSREKIGPWGGLHNWEDVTGTYSTARDFSQPFNNVTREEVESDIYRLPYLWIYEHQKIDKSRNNINKYRREINNHKQTEMGKYPITDNGEYIQTRSNFFGHKPIVKEVIDLVVKHKNPKVSYIETLGLPTRETTLGLDKSRMTNPDKDKSTTQTQLISGWAQMNHARKPNRYYSDLNKSVKENIDNGKVTNSKYLDALLEQENALREDAELLKPIESSPLDYMFEDYAKRNPNPGDKHYKDRVKYSGWTAWNDSGIRDYIQKNYPEFYNGMMNEIKTNNYTATMPELKKRLDAIKANK